MNLNIKKLSKHLALIGLINLTSISTSIAQDIEVMELDETSNNLMAFEERLETLNDNSVLYIDLNFVSSSDRSFTKGQNCKGNVFGPLPHKYDQEFSFHPDQDNNHLNLSIYPGSKISFPFNDVSCVYQAASPNVPTIRFRGFYVAIKHSVPTATLIELRPIDIAADRAMSITSTLLNSHDEEEEDIYTTYSSKNDQCTGSPNSLITYAKASISGPNFHCGLTNDTPAGTGLVNFDGQCTIDGQKVSDIVTIDLGNYSDHFEVALPTRDHWLKMFPCTPVADLKN
ncbi:MAG: hypothetical protein AB8B49_09585 [Nitratireductor sp.]